MFLTFWVYSLKMFLTCSYFSHFLTILVKFSKKLHVLESAKLYHVPFGFKALCSYILCSYKKRVTHFEKSQTFETYETFIQMTKKLLGDGNF